MSVAAISSKLNIPSTTSTFGAALDDGTRRAAIRDILERVGIKGNVVSISDAEEAIGKLKCDGQNWDYTGATFRPSPSEPRDPYFVDVEKWVDVLVSRGNIA